MEDKRQHYLPHGILWEHMSSTWHIEDKYVLPSSLNNFIKLNYMGKYSCNSMGSLFGNRFILNKSSKPNNKCILLRGKEILDSYES